jgi:hypothetical protein
LSNGFQATIRAADNSAADNSAGTAAENPVARGDGRLFAAINAYDNEDDEA